MKLSSLNKKQLQYEIFSLMDDVLEQLKNNTNVDKFLDETKLFDRWEEILPEAEFPILVMAVLNNIRRKAVIDSIINAVQYRKKTIINSNYCKTEAENAIPKIGDHPFN